MNTSIAFWTVAALIMAASVGTLVLPLLRSAGGTTTRRPRVAMALAVVVPLAVVGLYLQVGSPRALTSSGSEALPEGHAVQQQAGHVDEGMDALVAKLAERLKDNPGDGSGWELLARSYVELRQFPEAAKAFEKAAAVLRNDPQLLADYADALAMAGGRRLAGKPTELIKQALALDPRHEKALLLAGSAAFDAKNYREAIGYWQRLAQVAEPGSDVAREAEGNIAEARALLGEPAPAASSTDALKEQLAQRLTQRPAAGAPAGGASVSGQVVIAPALAARVSPSDTLFVYARAAGGPKMPLAILRLTAGALPARFTLDDSMAMASGAKLSDFRDVTIVARITKSGGASPQSGDLIGEAKNVSPGARDLRIVIDSTMP